MVLIIAASLVFLYLHLRNAVQVKSIDFYVNPELVTEAQTPIDIVIVVDAGIPVAVEVASDLRIFADDLELARVSVPAQKVGRGLSELLAGVVLNNMLLDDVWYRHLARGESSDLRVEGGVRIGIAAFSVKIPVSYTHRVETRIFPFEKRLDREYDLQPFGKVVVRDVRIELKDVTQRETRLKAYVTIENELTAQLYVKGLEFRLVTERGTVIAEGEQIGEALIARGERGTIDFEIVIDNTRIPKLWYEHIRNREKTTVIIEIWLRVEVMGVKARLGPLMIPREVETNIFKYR
ncbi:MAG: hypothetical protein QXS85_06165 [Acidilobaceae archaeon]